MSAYYNENDPKAAAWLRQLISENLIAPGVVDERSITEVKPHELTSYTQCHFFAGIGGWSLALRLAGWPDDRPVWTGSCPCQPFSTAGKGLGDKDERHLWPIFASLIQSCKPPVCFGEQVASKAGRTWLAGVFADLEGMGYQRAGADLCAAGVKAPHIRQRLYWVAHHHYQGLQRRECGELPECAVELPTGAGGACGGVADSLHGRPQERWTGARQALPKMARRGCETADFCTETPEPSRTSGRLVQPDSDGREEGSQAITSARHGNPAVAASGQPAGLDNAISNGRKKRRHNHARHVGHVADAAHELNSRMGNTDEPGSQGRNERILECAYQWPAGTPNLVVCCSDGKARRFESGSFPLAHGVSHRVGLLRGYGNAIVPQVAAEFITAYEETMHNERPHLQLNHAMPAIGDIYRKGTRLYVEVTYVSAKEIKYAIRPDGGEVSVDPAEFEVLARKSIENGAVMERSAMMDEMFN